MANYRIHQMNERLSAAESRLAWYGGGERGEPAAADAQPLPAMRFIHVAGYRRSLSPEETFEQARKGAQLQLSRPGGMLLLSGEAGVSCWYGVPWDVGEPLLLTTALSEPQLTGRALSPRALGETARFGGVLSGPLKAEAGGLDRVLTALAGRRFFVGIFSLPLDRGEIEDCRRGLEEEISQYKAVEKTQLSFGSGFGIRRQERPLPQSVQLLELLRKRRADLEKLGGGCRGCLLYGGADRDTAALLGSLLEGAFQGEGEEGVEAVSLGFSPLDPMGGLHMPRSEGRPFFDRLAWVFPREQLGALFCPPLHQHTSFVVLEPEEMGAVHPFDNPRRKSGPVIELGRTGGGSLYQLPVAMLGRHTLVCGKTRSGKSTTVQAILLSLPVPFLVLETRKKEYRNLCGALQGLRVYSAGGDALPLAWNPLRPEPGVRIGEHISGLMTAFTGAFDLEDPLTGAFYGLLEETYRRFGWTLEMAAPSRLPAGRRYPTVRDLAAGIEDYVAAHVHHGPEVRSNIRGALDNRVAQRICGGLCGRIFSGEGSLAEELLAGPAVVELDDLQGEEKSLTASLLLLSLNESIRRRPESSDLQHLLVIEEAHTVFRAPSAGVSRAAARVTEQFSDMLAEISAYGVGLVIADQRVSALHPSAVANTAVRIIHNQDEREDVDAVAGALHLGESRRSLLAELGQGQAVVRISGEHQVSRIQVTDRALGIPAPFSEGCAFCRAKSCLKEETAARLTGLSREELAFYGAGLFHPDLRRASQAAWELGRRFFIEGPALFCTAAAVASRCTGYPLYERRRAVAAMLTEGGQR